MTVDLPTIFGRNLRAFRYSKEMSQQALADLIGVHHTYIGAVERGKTNVTLQTLEKFAMAADFDPVDLLDPSWTPGRS